MTNKSMKVIKESYFTTIVVDVAALRRIYARDFICLQERYNVRDDEYEDAYDWMMAETISNIVVIPQKSVVVGHYKHDVYRSMYDHFKLTFEIFIRSNRVLSSIVYAPGTKVKLLVAGPNIYIVKQGVIDE